MSFDHVLSKTLKMLVSSCCFAEDGGETYQIVFCTCFFIVCLLTILDLVSKETVCCVDGRVKH